MLLKLGREAIEPEHRGDDFEGIGQRIARGKGVSAMFWKEPIRQHEGIATRSGEEQIAGPHLFARNPSRLSKSMKILSRLPGGGGFGAAVAQPD